MSRKPTVTLAFVALLASSCFASTSMVDQQYVPTTANTNGNLADDLDFSQVFTVGIRGELTGIDVLMFRDDGVSDPLLLDVRRTVAGKPTDADSGPNILASGIVNASDIPLGRNPNNYIHFELTPSVPVEVGDILAFVLQTNDTPVVGYSWIGDPGTYSGGNEYYRATFVGNTWTMREKFGGFRTYVAAVPEPHLMAMILSAAISLALVGRRLR
jgi:hypothetical protein